MSRLAATTIVLLLPLAACAGVSPSPAELGSRELPPAADGVDLDLVRRREAAVLQLLAQRRYPEVETAAAALLELDPRAARTRAALAVALLERTAEQEPDLALQNRAEGESRSAAAIAPADPVVGLLRCRLLTRLGHLSAAADVAEECLRRNAPSADPDYLDLLEAVGERCYELGEEQRALPHLRALVAHRPDDPNLQFRLGACSLRVASDADAAIAAAAAFARSAALAPGDDDVHLAVVAAHLQAAEAARRARRPTVATAQLEAAAAAATVAAARFDGLAEASFRLGVVKELQADPDAARAAYLEALQRDPEHLGSLLNLASLPSTAATAPQPHELWRRALAVDAAHGGLTAGERARIEALLAR